MQHKIEKKGESFLIFLQSWRRLFARYAHPIPEKEKMKIFIDNLNDEMSYRLELQCAPTFEKMIENGLKIKEALVKRGVLKIYNEGNNSANSSKHYNSNDKPKFWQRSKNFGNNDVAAETQNAKPVFNLTFVTSKNNTNTNQNTNQNSNQNNVESKPPPYRTSSNRRRFTPLG